MNKPKMVKKRFSKILNEEFEVIDGLCVFPKATYNKAEQLIMKMLSDDNKVVCHKIKGLFGGDIVSKPPPKIRVPVPDELKFKFMKKYKKK